MEEPPFGGACRPGSWNPEGGILEKESWRRNPEGGNLEEESWRRNPGEESWKGIPGKGSWRNPAGEILEEESWRRNLGGGILESRKHLGGLWKASRSLGCLGSSLGLRGSFCIVKHSKFEKSDRFAAEWRR